MKSKQIKKYIASLFEPKYSCEHCHFEQYTVNEGDDNNPKQVCIVSNKEISSKSTSCDKFVLKELGPAKERDWIHLLQRWEASSITGKMTETKKSVCGREFDKEALAKLGTKRFTQQENQITCPHCLKVVNGPRTHYTEIGYESEDEPHKIFCGIGIHDQLITDHRWSFSTDRKSVTCKLCLAKIKKMDDEKEDDIVKILNSCFRKINYKS